MLRCQTDRFSNRIDGLTIFKQFILVNEVSANDDLRQVHRFNRRYFDGLIDLCRAVGGWCYSGCRRNDCAAHGTLLITNEPPRFRLVSPDKTGSVTVSTHETFISGDFAGSGVGVCCNTCARLASKRLSKLTLAEELCICGGDARQQNKHQQQKKLHRKSALKMESQRYLNSSHRNYSSP